MNRVRFFRYIIALFILMMVFILQSSVLSAIAIRGIIPNLTVVTVVSFALLRGRVDGAVVGGILGLLQDIYYGPVVGFYAIVFMLLGYATGYLYRNFYRDSVLVPIGIMLIGDLYQNFLVYFFTFLFRGRLSFGVYMAQIMIPEMIYTLFVGFFVYRIYYQINQFVEQVEWEKENEE